MNIAVRVCIFVIFTATLTFSLSGQSRLDYGVEVPPANVKTPYIYWDYLRTMAPEWVREQRSMPTASWQLYSHSLSEKDTAGRFTRLEYKTWDAGQAAWQGNEYTYTYTLDVSNRIIEMEINYGGGYINALSYGYNALGQLRKTTYLNGNVTTKTYHSYNSQGLNTVDSNFYMMGRYDSMLSFIIYYEFDGNSDCIKTAKLRYSTFTSSWDTIEHLFYTWQNGLLASKEQHNMIMPQYRQEYTYTNGQPDDITFYEYDTTAKQLVPVSFYKHYYTNNRLAAMVSGTYNGANRKNADSVALTYLANNMLDTGYQFKGLTTGWETAPRYRLLFGKLNTSIAPVPVVVAVKLYPNPVSDYLSVDLQLVADGSFSVDITDMTGKTVRTVNILNMSAGINTIRIPVQDLAAGVYFITCGNSTEKIIKQ